MEEEKGEKGRRIEERRKMSREKGCWKKGERKSVAMGGGEEAGRGEVGEGDKMRGYTGCAEYKKNYDTSVGPSVRWSMMLL